MPERNFVLIIRIQRSQFIHVSLANIFSSCLNENSTELKCIINFYFCGMERQLLGN